MCEVKEDGGRRDGEDSIISARLVQFVTPAVVFNQPPWAACTANSLIISRSLSLSPACLLSLLAGQLQQMGAVSHDPQPPPDPPTRGTSLNTHKSNAHTVYMLSTCESHPATASCYKKTIFLKNSYYCFSHRGLKLRPRSKN